jgi:hypothetical protein
MHMANYEPSYLVLMEAASLYGDGEIELSEARDMLADAVEKHWEAMGLQLSDLDDDVDYASMIEYEIG